MSNNGKWYSESELVQLGQYRQNWLNELYSNVVAIYLQKYGREIGTIFFQYGTWAVTDYGLECLTEYYVIEGKRVSETDWPKHMDDKGWVEMKDFLMCFVIVAFALTLFGHSTPVRLFLSCGDGIEVAN